MLVWLMVLAVYVRNEDTISHGSCVHCFVREAPFDGVLVPAHLMQQAAVAFCMLLDFHYKQLVVLQVAQEKVAATHQVVGLYFDGILQPDDAREC